MSKPASKKADTPPVRKLKKPRYRSFRLQKAIKHPAPPLTGSFKLFARSLKTIWQHKRFFIKLVLLYGVFTFIFVRGFGGGMNVRDVKEVFQSAYQENFNNLSTSFSIFGYLLGTSVATNTDSEVVPQYQFILFVVVSLATVWALRQLLAGTKIRLRDAFYKGMYPLMPFLGVLLIMGLQLIPLLVGNFIYSTVRDNGLAVSSLEQTVWVLIYGLLALLTLYMISSSIFGLYIVALPDMTPRRALRSARKLVAFRRFTVMRRVFLLPVLLIATAGILVIPAVLWAEQYAEPLFYVLSMVGLPLIHVYFYTLYRELLKKSA